MKAVNDNKTLIEIYPIGSIIKFDEDVDPNEKIGGKWELVEKNNPIYILSDTKVMRGNGQNWLLFDTMENIVGLFEKDYGFRPNSTQIGMSFYNGDADATTRRILGADISNNGANLNITFDSPHSGQIRINYLFVAKDLSNIICKWKRVE